MVKNGILKIIPILETQDIPCAYPVEEFLETSSDRVVSAKATASSRTVPRVVPFAFSFTEDRPCGVQIPMKTVPTGVFGVPPPGPAIPVVLNAKSV